MPLPGAGPTDCSSGLSKRIFKALQYDNPWKASQTYVVGVSGCPTTPNGFGYQISAITTGISAGSEPTWPVIINNTVTDGGVTWKCIEVAQPSGKGPTFTGYAYLAADLDYLRFLAWNHAKAMCDEIAADVESWIAFPHAANWADFGGTNQPCQYMKDSMGFVCLRGLNKYALAGAGDIVMGTLPAGYRPVCQAAFACANWDNVNYVAGALYVNPDGTVHARTWTNGGVNTSGFDLSPVRFDTR